MKKNFYAFSLSLGLALSASAAEKIENFSHYYRQDCTFVTKQDADRNDWCNRGNAAGKAPNVVMIGDSYGNSSTTILEAYATSAVGKQLIYEQYGRGQCPELLGIGPKECSDFAQTVYERVKKMPSVKTVVLASHWIYYFGQTRQWNGDARVYTRVEMQKALAETIKAYQALEKKVVLMYQAPEIDEPKVCVQRRIRIAVTEDKCRLTRDWGWRNEVYRPFIDPTLAQFKIETFDPFVYMCDAKECQVRDGDKIFFSSQAHFSGFGGQYLAHKAAPDLKKLLGL